MIRQRRHGPALAVRRLLLQHRPVDGAAVNARRRPGLQPADRQADLAQLHAQRGCCPLAGTTADIDILAPEQLAAQEGAGGQHDRGRRQRPAIGQRQTGHRALADDQAHRLALNNLQPRLGVKHLVDRRLVALAVGLHARPLHGGALAAVEHAIMDRSGVSRAADQAVERVDLADQMALAQTADRRVAGHGTHGRPLEGQQRHRCALARCRSGRLAAGMAATDHDHIIACSHGGPISDSGARGQKRSTWNIALSAITRGNFAYFPIQNPEKRRSSISSVPACPVSASIVRRPRRNSSANTSRSRAAPAAIRWSCKARTPSRCRACRA